MLYILTVNGVYLLPLERRAGIFYFLKLVRTRLNQQRPLHKRSLLICIVLFLLHEFFFYHTQLFTYLGKCCDGLIQVMTVMRR